MRAETLTLPLVPEDRQVPWLNRCAKQWTFMPIKYSCLINSRTLTDTTSPDYEFQYIDIGNVDSQGDYTASEPMLFVDAPSRARRILIDGDVLISTVRTYLRAITQVKNPKELICSTGFAVLSSGPSVDAGFLSYWVRSSFFVDEVVARSTGVSYPAVNASEIASLPIPVLDLISQKLIAVFLDRETARIDALIEKKERQIALLQEKRAALISHLTTQGINPKAKMRDSGVEWLPTVPVHWKIDRAKILFREINDRSEEGDEELLTVSHITGVTKRSEKNVYMFMAETLEGYKKCQAGDLVINTMWAWMGAMGITEVTGIVSPSYNVYRFRHNAICPKFYDYLFRTGRFIAEASAYSKGVWKSRLRLYPEGFFEIRIPMPPKEEQAAIVAAIAKETGTYEAMQMKIESSIETLIEYRSALITAAVTGKIDVRGEVA